MSTELEFDCLVTFIADTIVQSSYCDDQDDGGVRVVILQQELCEKYGPEYFCQKPNADLLADAIEYLLYTKRVIPMPPDC